jgi:hypothetical protein
LYAVNTERVKGQFTNEQQTIVNEFVPQIKDALSKAILVSFPPEDRNIPLVIYTDASDYAIGATIGYFNEANEFVNLGTHSRSLHGYEQRYTTTKKELLAAFDGVQTFTHLLHGYKSITLYTDHNPLCFTSAKKEDLARTESIWWTELSHWPITFKHIPGIDNVLADYLSRDLYLDESGKPTPNTSLFSDIEIEPSTFSSHQSFFSFATTRNMALTKTSCFLLPPLLALLLRNLRTTRVLLLPHLFLCNHQHQQLTSPSPHLDQKRPSPELPPQLLPHSQRLLRLSLLIHPALLVLPLLISLKANGTSLSSKFIAAIMVMQS